jgi:hypothetical protein
LYERFGLSLIHQNTPDMKTLDSKNLKKELQAHGITVKRVLTYKGGVIVTIDMDHVSICERFLMERNIKCVRPMNAPISAKANILGYANAAEFTSLFQL